MKVCFISHYAYRLFNENSQITFGGNEVLYFLIAKKLAQDRRFGVSFLLETDRSKTETISKIKLFKTSRQQGLIKGNNKTLDFLTKLFARIAERFNTLWNLPHQDFFRLGERLKTINADVYIQGSATYEIGPVVFWSKLFRKKCIFLIGHDDDVNQTYVKNHRWGKIYEWGLKHADLIWCTSVRHQQLLWKNYRLRATYIPYWFPVPKKILPQNKRRQILWIARLDPWKNPEAFLKLAKSLPGQKFIMIASTSEGHQDYFKKISNQAKKIPRLSLKTNVPFSRISKYYQQAKLFIDTSDYGSLHTSHLMAAVAGTPAITLFRDPNDSFKEYGWGLNAKGSFKKFRQQVELALNQPGLWQELSQKAIIFSKKVHNLDKLVHQFKTMLLNLSTTSDKS